MWQAHGGRHRCAVELGLADQTGCPTTQGRWGSFARCACVECGQFRSLRLRLMGQGRSLRLCPPHDLVFSTVFTLPFLQSVFPCPRCEERVRVLELPWRWRFRESRCFESELDSRGPEWKWDLWASGLCIAAVD